MDGARDYHTKIIITNSAEKYKYMISLTCRILKKNYTNELVYKTETDLQK